MAKNSLSAFLNRKMKEANDGVKYREGWLNPVAQKERDFKFMVADIESMNWVNFLCIGIYDGECFEYYENMMEFFDAIALWARVECEGKTRQIKAREFEGETWEMVETDRNVISVSVFVHNGGRFDFNFFMKALYDESNPHIYFADGIPIGSSILLMKVHYIWGNDVIEICFWDSTKLLPFSLWELTHSFDVEHKKLEIDHTETTGITPDLIHYLEHDCKGHYEVMKKFYSWGKVATAPKSYTMASQSFAIFRTFLESAIPPLRDEDDLKFRKGYYGGRTEIFKPMFDDETRYLKAFDVNSLYPSMMRDSIICSQPYREVNRFDDSKWGIWNLEIEVPDMYIPPLPAVAKVGKVNKLIFPTGNLTGWWETNEINYALSLGCKIKKVYGGTIFKNGDYLFQDFVNYFYELRLKAKKEGDQVSQIMCKLILNSLYGRFAIRKERELIQEFFGQDFNNVVGDVFLREVSKDGKMMNAFTRLVTVPTEYKGYSNVAISMQITANARVSVHKRYMEAPEEMYYTDTDSLYSTHDYKSDNIKLGELKYEGKSHQACFILPKTYVWMEEDEKTGEVHKKIRMKGFNSKTSDDGDIEALHEELLAEKMRLQKDAKKLSKTDQAKLDIFDRKLFTKNINEFTFENFCDYLEGSQRLVNVQQEKFATFRSAVRKGEFVTMMDANIKEVRQKYDKRFLFKTENGSYDTRPLFLTKEGVVK